MVTGIIEALILEGRMEEAEEIISIEGGLDTLSEEAFLAFKEFIEGSPGKIQ